ncbi:LysR family transcriptional regulator [Thioclava sp. GXIMD4216]|uniref:LysR family transcriptional regulator n=1 Tax=Thioclava litoralis TaxID=3076557 RepID=A0ABZ1DXB8_9RHOB|nr:LysR family transcriptional regulator [Thioclava sp. FTW29]
MDTRHMRLFVALGETLNFGQAAARMNMTQPPFSRQIANLERDIGTVLVDRSARQTRLTAAGQRFLEDARKVLASFEDACRDARLVGEGLKGELRLGFMMHAAHRLVPNLLRAYTALRPDVRVRLEETTPGEIENLLLSGVLDAGITFAGRTTPALHEVEVMRDTLSFVCCPTHPLAKRAIIHPEDLKAQPLIAAPDQTVAVLRHAITEFLARAGLPAHFTLEPKLQNTVLRLIAADLGVALVPSSICDQLGAEVVMRPLFQPPHLSVVLKTRRDADNAALAPLITLAQNINI